MKTIKSLKDITILEIGDVVVFGNLKYVVDNNYHDNSTYYYLRYPEGDNGIIFKKLNLKKRDFTEKLGIDANCTCDFPETRSLEALTAIVSALFKEYEKKGELPKTWKEFCIKNPIQDVECYIDIHSNIESLFNKTGRKDESDRNVCTSKQEANAFLALMQLRQLRKCYVKDWEPDWNHRQLIYTIKYDYVLNKLIIEISSIWGNCMSFPTCGLAEQFLNNFKDLLEIAKPLL